jgi:hypothetical protein
VKNPMKGGKLAKEKIIIINKKEMYLLIKYKDFK